MELGTRHLTDEARHRHVHGILEFYLYTQHHLSLMIFTACLSVIKVFNTCCSKAIELSSFVLLLVLMPVSVPLSYKCAVYFLIKNLHFIIGSVKIAELPSSAIT